MDNVPYIEVKTSSENVFIRTFKSTINPDEMQWHQDLEDREFVVISGIGWKIQKESQLPELLEVGKSYKVKAFQWHRGIKPDNDSDLVIKVTKFFQ